MTLTTTEPSGGNRLIRSIEKGAFRALNGRAKIESVDDLLGINPTLRNFLQHVVHEEGFKFSHMAAAVAGFPPFEDLSGISDKALQGRFLLHNTHRHFKDDVIDIETLIVKDRQVPLIKGKHVIGGLMRLVGENLAKIPNSTSEHRLEIPEGCEYLKGDSELVLRLSKEDEYRILGSVEVSPHFMNGECSPEIIGATLERAITNLVTSEEFMQYPTLNSLSVDFNEHGIDMSEIMDVKIRTEELMGVDQLGAVLGEGGLKFRYLIKADDSNSVTLRDLKASSMGLKVSRDPIGAVGIDRTNRLLHLMELSSQTQVRDWQETGVMRMSQFIGYFQEKLRDALNVELGEVYRERVRTMSQGNLSPEGIFKLGLAQCLNDLGVGKAVINRAIREGYLSEYNSGFRNRHWRKGGVGGILPRQPELPNSEIYRRIDQA